MGACDPGWGDCDQSAANGCETPVDTDTANCGACGNACAAPPHASAACTAGKCGMGACDSGFDDCDANPANGCECSYPAPPAGPGTTLPDCNASLDPTKNGGDLLWLQRGYMHIPQGTYKASPLIHTFGPTGDLVVRSIVNGFPLEAHLIHYSALGEKLGETWQSSVYGYASVSAAFGADNAYYAESDWGSHTSTYMQLDGPGFTITGNEWLPWELTRLAGDVRADGLGNVFFIGAPDGGPPYTPLSYSPGPTLPAAGRYLIRATPQAQTFHTTFGESYRPDETGGVLSFGPFPSTADVGCGPMPSGVGFLSRHDASWGCVYSHPLPVVPKVLAIGGGGALVSATSTTALDLGCGPLPAAPGGSTFVTRLDASGACVYGLALGAPNLAITADRSGRVMAGGVVGSGPVSIGGTTLPPIGAADLVVAELDAAGQLLWSRRFGGAGVTFSNTEVTASASGDVYVRTSFAGTVDLGGGPLTATATDTVVGSYSPAGAHRWSRVIALSGGYDAQVDACGALVVVSGDSAFNAGAGFPLATTGFYNVAILRYAP
jgi:hypothetical protein